MDASRTEASSRNTISTIPLRPRIRWRALCWSAFLPLIILSGILLNRTMLIPTTFAAPAALYSMPGHNTFQQFLQLGQWNNAYRGLLVRPSVQHSSQIATQSQLPPSAEPPTMTPITQALTSTQIDPAMVRAAGVQPLDLTGSDGRLEVQVAPGMFDLTHALTAQGVAPSGTLSLSITQIHGHAISTSNLLGAYQIQVLDSTGKPLSNVALRVPLTLIYHYQPWEMDALNLDPDQIFLSWPGLITAAQAAHQSSAPDVVLFTNNAQAHTLTAHTGVID